MPIASERQNAHIPKDLKLLADFVADMAVLWMQARQVFVERVNLGQLERFLIEGAYYVQNIERPSATFCTERSYGLELSKCAANVTSGNSLLFVDQRNPSIAGYPLQKDVAANPTSTSRGRGQRPSAFESGQGKRKIGNEKQRHY